MGSPVGLAGAASAPEHDTLEAGLVRKPEKAHQHYTEDAVRQAEGAESVAGEKMSHSAPEREITAVRIGIGTQN